MNRYTFDLEVLSNFFWAGIYAHEDNPNDNLLEFSHWKSRNYIPRFREWVEGLGPDDILYSYNGWGYDLVITRAILDGEVTTNEQARELSNEIIRTQKRGEWYPRADLESFPFQNVDLKELLNIKFNLKKLAANLGFPCIEEAPIDLSSDDPITLEEKKAIVHYGRIDVRATAYIADWAANEEKIRRNLVKKYHLAPQDVTLGRPRIGARVISQLWKDKHGDYPRKPEWEDLPDMMYFKRVIDPRINFKTPELQEFLDEIRGFRRKLNQKKYARKLNFFGRTLSVGEGGIHDEFGPRTLKATDTMKLLDIDVSSYYPTLMENLNLVSPHLPGLNYMIGNLKEHRLKEKYAGNVEDATSLKVVLNTPYGLLGNQYSFMYYPLGRIGVCLNGQLYLIMLMERLKLIGIECYYSNTDGIVVAVPHEQEQVVRDVVDRWNKKFNLRSDIEEWDAIYCRDVSNYFWVRGNKVKRKGVFKPSGTEPDKAWKADVIPNAVIDYFTKGIDPAHTVMAAPLSDFCYVVAPTKKYLHNRYDIYGSVGGSLPRTVRYFHSQPGYGGRLYKYNENTGGTINYANATSVRIIQDLDPELETDLMSVDFDFYIEEARQHIADLQDAYIPLG